MSKNISKVLHVRFEMAQLLLFNSIAIVIFINCQIIHIYTHSGAHSHTYAQIFVCYLQYQVQSPEIKPQTLGTAPQKPHDTLHSPPLSHTLAPSIAVSLPPIHFCDIYQFVALPRLQKHLNAPNPFAGNNDTRCVYAI